MRADLFLVKHGYFETRAKAQAAIAAGGVRVDGRALTKPSQTLRPGVRVEAEPAHPYVGRAALKLIAGMDAFKVDPAGRVCLDVGASTGGFTQVLLERGAETVFAVDTGRGQLHPSLRADPRVVSLETTDARDLSPRLIDRPPGLVVCDASFISLAKVLPAALDLAAPGARLIALFKPQFEVGRAHVGKGGIVKDEAVVQAAMARTLDFLQVSGWTVSGTAESPITGGDGNREWLIGASKPG